MGTLAFEDPRTLTDADAVRIVGLRGLRYGEVLLVRRRAERFEAEVWNSMGLGECPQDAWDALDPAAIASEKDALLAMLNGPRHWLMDVIENVPRPDRRLDRFGDIDMSLVATVDLGSDIPTAEPYTERSVARDTIWEWSPGRTVHELVRPDGAVFTMQAYCLAVDDTLGEDALDGIGSRLNPPAGWTYRSRRLEEPLALRAPDGVATVIQDELQNTYMR